MTRYWYDCEFLEDGKTIELISIGIVSDDGREYYAVNSEAPWERVKGRDWLVRNVLPSLPLTGRDSLDHYLQKGHRRDLAYVDVDTTDTRVKPHWVIANEVRDFLLTGGPVELWGYCASYDHVVVAQLWGPMIKRPEGLPFWTNDIQQIMHAHGLGETDLPAQEGAAHNALDDARWTRAAWEYLAERVTIGLTRVGVLSVEETEQ